MKIRSLTLLVLLLALRMSADTLDLGVHGTFQITVPDGWVYSARKAADAGYGSVLKPTDGAHAKCMFTIAYLPKATPLDHKAIDGKVRSVCEAFVKSSVEKKIVLKSFDIANGYGSYNVFTDASLVNKPPPTGDDYKIFASGVIQWGDDVMGIVSIFCDDKNAPEFESMLKAVSSATVIRKK